jgi:lipopolysaccharide biosynthesis glycosyltransferase
VDVSPLFETAMESKAMGFVVSGTVSMALESKFFLSLGKAPDSPSFNSGTMLFNLPEWRRQDCSTRVLAFCREHSAELAAADQTALNALFANDCFRLDPQYNVQVLGTTAPEAIPANGVFHFVGSPKPWDIGGSLLLPHAGPWFDDLCQTAVPPLQRFSWLNWGAWKRLPRILGGYRRILRDRMAQD